MENTEKSTPRFKGLKPSFNAAHVRHAKIAETHGPCEYCGNDAHNTYQGVRMCVKCAKEARKNTRWPKKKK